MQAPDDAAVRALMALARARAAAPDSVLNDLTTWFASKDAVGAEKLPTDLVDRLGRVGLNRWAVETAAGMVLAEPMTGRTRHGAPTSYAGMPAARWVASEEPRMRAQYLLAAAGRLTNALADERTDDALKAEQRYLGQHVDAGRNRRRAARAVDQVGGDGQVLVWRTRHDNRVEGFCRSMEGRLFTASNPPGGVYPGAAHPRCRCHAEVFGDGPLLNWGSTP